MSPVRFPSGFQSVRIGAERHGERKIGTARRRGLFFASSGEIL
jgi:hypothetical protein